MAKEFKIPTWKLIPCKGIDPKLEISPLTGFNEYGSQVSTPSKLEWGANEQATGWFPSSALKKLLFIILLIPMQIGIC